MTPSLKFVFAVHLGCCPSGLRSGEALPSHALLPRSSGSANFVPAGQLHCVLRLHLLPLTGLRQSGLGFWRGCWEVQLAREGRCVEFGAFSFRGHTIVVIVDREAVSGAKAYLLIY